MKMPVFCINRLRHFRMVMYGANVMLFVLCLLTVFPVADSTEYASAEVNGDNYELTLGMNGNVDMTISPNSEGVLNIAKNTIVGSTNAPNGYKLYIASANEYTSMFLDGEEYNKDDYQARMLPISGTFDTPEALFSTENTPATWGYAVPSLNNFDATYDTENPNSSAKFAGMPASGSGQLIHSADTAVSNDEIEVYYGTKVNQKLRQGKYKTWINYIAVTDFSTIINNGITVSPERIRNNYKSGTRVTMTANFNAGEDLGTFLPTINNLTCANPQKITNEPLTITCEIPDGLTNGVYGATLNIPQLGKTFEIANAITIVDAYDSMQGVNEAVYNSVDVDGEYVFYDERDNKKYFITKLRNGDLYMTQNLNFEISQNGTTLDPATSDVSTVKTVTANPDTHMNFEGAIDKLLNDGLFSYIDGGIYYVDPVNLGVVQDDTATDESPIRHYNYGGLYSIDTIMTEPLSDNMSTSDSICPKGWHLPLFDYNDGENFIDMYTNSFMGDSYGTNLANAPLYIPTFTGGKLSMLIQGTSFTNHEEVTAEDYLRFTYGNKTPAEIRQLLEDTSNAEGEESQEYELYDLAYAEMVFSMNVRCYYPAPHKYAIIYDANGGTNAPEGQYQGSWDTVSSVRFNVSKDIPVREGYLFKGWATTNTATVAEYQPGNSFTATGRHTLYAVWEKPNAHNYFDDAFAEAGKTKTNGYYAMQDMTEGICAAVPAPVNSYDAQSTQLIDLRDNKIYFVSKLADNQCWMTQNLDFEIDGNGTTLDPATSSVAVATTIKATDFGTANYYQDYGNLAYRKGYKTVDNILTTASSSSDLLWHYLVGSSYNYAAATANLSTSNVGSVNYTDSMIVEGNGTVGGVQDDTDDTEYIKIGEKYSHTYNVSDTGHTGGYYPDSCNERCIRGTDRVSYDEPHVVKIDGAVKLKVDIYYDTELSHDYVIVWPGDHSDFRIDIDTIPSEARKYAAHGYTNYTLPSGDIYKLRMASFEIDGDTVTFDFLSDSDYYFGTIGYGYYAIVSGYYYKEEDNRVQESICPKGWRLPHADENSNEFANLGSSLEALLDTPNYFISKDKKAQYISDSSMKSLLGYISGENKNGETGFIHCVAEDTFVKSLYFDANGGENAPEGYHAMSTIDPLFKSEVTIPLEAPTREGYTFAGWASVSDASIAEYAPGDSITIIGANVLYAVWQEVNP